MTRLVPFGLMALLAELLLALTLLTNLLLTWRFGQSMCIVLVGHKGDVRIPACARRVPGVCPAHTNDATSVNLLKRRTSVERSDILANIKMTSYNEAVAFVSRNIRKKYIPKRRRADTPDPRLKPKRVRPTTMTTDIVPNLPCAPQNSPVGRDWMYGPAGLQPLDHALHAHVYKTAPRRTLCGVFDAVENLADLFEYSHLY